jgi:hypothetical protein
MSGRFVRAGATAPQGGIMDRSSEPGDWPRVAENEEPANI